ncbi:hypothetical protein CHUAL_003581 [Chamberlinius hualienensis]
MVFTKMLLFFRILFIIKAIKIPSESTHHQFDATTTTENSTQDATDLVIIKCHQPIAAQYCFNNVSIAQTDNYNLDSKICSINMKKFQTFFNKDSCPDHLLITPEFSQTSEDNNTEDDLVESLDSTSSFNCSLLINHVEMTELTLCYVETQGYVLLNISKDNVEEETSTSGMSIGSSTPLLQSETSYTGITDSDEATESSTLEYSSDTNTNSNIGVGAGIGVAVTIIVVAIVILYYYRKYHRRKSPKKPESDETCMGKTFTALDNTKDTAEVKMETAPGSTNNAETIWLPQPNLVAASNDQDNEDERTLSSSQANSTSGDGNSAKLDNDDAQDDLIIVHQSTISTQV